MKSKRLRVGLVVLILVSIAADHLTKWVAQIYLDAPNVQYGWPQSGPLQNLFELRYARNPGAFLSMFAGLPDSLRIWVLLGINGVILAGLGVFLLFKKDLHWFPSVALALVFSGGVGNMIDRVFRDNHEVADYMVMGIGRLHTGVFNIADVAIMAGVFGLLGYEFFFAKHPVPDKE